MSFRAPSILGLVTRTNDLWHRLSNRRLRDAFRITSHLTMRERVTLYRLAQGRDTAIEIGSYLGASACCIGLAMKESGRGTLICIDTWANDAMSEGRRDTFAEFVRNTQQYRQHLIHVRGKSEDVIEQVGAILRTVNLLFIDGDHSYQGVKADWEAYRRFLERGSVVVFHDWGWADGVRRVINEDVKPCVDSFGYLPNMWWGELNQ
jgi:predicted O-methyltransferase YrrM